MEEQLITLETAKLAKEKGFNQNPYITKNAYLPRYIDGTDVYLNGALFSPYYNIAVAPSQSLLQKWLREKHNIIVYFIPSLTPNGVYFTYQIYGKSIVFEESKWKETPEEALEIGLQEALKLI